MQVLVSEVSISTLTPLLLDLWGKQSTMHGACGEQSSFLPRVGKSDRETGRTRARQTLHVTPHLW